MKMDRLIGILSILLQRERVTAPELAEQFEVSRRTIHVDHSDSFDTTMKKMIVSLLF